MKTLLRFLQSIACLWLAVGISAPLYGGIIINSYRFAAAAAGINLLASISAYSSTGHDITTGSINSSGATLLIVALADRATGSHTISDSKGNTWTALTGRTGGSLSQQTLYYCLSPTVGSGHTFSSTCGAASYPALAVTAWNGVSGFDKSAGASSTTQAGSITPAQNNSLIIFHATALTDAVSVSSGFTLHQNIVQHGNNYTIGLSYLIQATASAINPTISPSAFWGVTQACFY